MGGGGGVTIINMDQWWGDGRENKVPSYRGLSGPYLLKSGALIKTYGPSYRNTCMKSVISFLCVQP